MVSDHSLVYGPLDEPPRPVVTSSCLLNHLLLPYLSVSLRSLVAPETCHRSLSGHCMGHLNLDQWCPHVMVTVLWLTNVACTLFARLKTVLKSLVLKLAFSADVLLCVTLL